MVTPFPITTYGGEYLKQWTRAWTHLNDAWHFFEPSRGNVVLDEDVYRWDGAYGFNAEYNRFLPLAGPDNEWGAFKLVGLLQIDKGYKLKKVCGEVTTKVNDVRSFVAKGKQVERYRKSLGIANTGPPDVHCIPVKGKINLILVIANNDNGRYEVYFLRGKTGGARSQLPGMKEFYFKEKINQIFTNFANFWETLLC